MASKTSPDNSALSTRAKSAADAMAKLYPAQVIHPSCQSYIDAQQSFWNALQREATPSCFFRPTTVEQVQAAIVEVASRSCPFAIKGGGHSSNFKGSSIEAGFQFDLAGLDHIEIASDRKSVKLSPGVHWGPLFKRLEELNLMVVGGRDASVGVPGFIFGGGISNFAAKHGWGIDGLLSADIVLANGDLIRVDQTTHSDLFKAIRGGGAHNFGIVTNLTLKLFPFNGMWGGLSVVTEEHFDAFFDTYDEYTQQLAEDGKAEMIVDFVRQDGSMVACRWLSYPEPNANPPIYEAMRQVPSAIDTLRLASCSDLAIEMKELTNSCGQRNTYWTTATECDIGLLKSIYELWAKTTAPYQDQFRACMDVNHITPKMRNKAAEEGIGDVYGLQGPNVPLWNIMFTITWDNEVDDKLVTNLLRQLVVDVEAMSRSAGKFHPFKYMNYAHREQDVIGSYGQERKNFLKKVAKKYDPAGVFQKQQPGGFKLDVTFLVHL